MEILPILALIAAVGGTWGRGWYQRRQLRLAVTEAATQLNGRYKPGAHTSGGTLYGRYGGRDVVFIFRLSSTSRGESTTVTAIVGRPVSDFCLRGRDAVARVPLLARYRGWFGRVEAGASSHTVWLTVPQVVRESGRLLDLAQAVVALADECDGRRAT